MTKRRIGTIQSFRPGYGAVMPESALYGKLFAVFKAPSMHFEEDGRGSRARTRDLRFWRPPLYQLSYTPRPPVTLRRQAATATHPVAPFLIARRESFK